MWRLLPRNLPKKPYLYVYPLSLLKDPYIWMCGDSRQGICQKRLIHTSVKELFESKRDIRPCKRTIRRRGNSRRLLVHTSANEPFESSKRAVWRCQRALPTTKRQLPPIFCKEPCIQPWGDSTKASAKRVLFIRLPKQPYLISIRLPKEPYV